jgi:hypothetical protein
MPEFPKAQDPVSEEFWADKSNGNGRLMSREFNSIETDYRPEPTRPAGVSTPKPMGTPKPVAGSDTNSTLSDLEDKLAKDRKKTSVIGDTSKSGVLSQIRAGGGEVRSTPVVPAGAATSVVKRFSPALGGLSDMLSKMKWGYLR